MGDFNKGIAPTHDKPLIVESNSLLSVQAQILSELKKIRLYLQLIQGDKVTDQDIGD